MQVVVFMRTKIGLSKRLTNIYCSSPMVFGKDVKKKCSRNLWYRIRPHRGQEKLKKKVLLLCSGLKTEPNSPPNSKNLLFHIIWRNKNTAKISCITQYLCLSHFGWYKDVDWDGRWLYSLLCSLFLVREGGKTEHIIFKHCKLLLSLF